MLKKPKEIHQRSKTKINKSGQINNLKVPGCTIAEIIKWPLTPYIGY